VTADREDAAVKEAESPRFLADVMLGSLARWLRILGLDVEYDSGFEDSQLVERGLAEGRWLLTRDRRLTERRRLPRCLLIRSQRLEEQIRQVLEETGIRRDRLKVFGRCLRCNRELQEVERREVLGSVPEHVAATQSAFRRCPGCGRIFWKATHVERMRRRLRTLGLEI
jgi:uncharacterized protein with PIN domain